jgi:serine/threonine protein kinase
LTTWLWSTWKTRRWRSGSPGPLELEQVLQYATEISDALDKAHRRDITHRDLMPGNFLLTKTGTKLLDFGLAKLKPETGPAATAATGGRVQHKRRVYFDDRQQVSQRKSSRKKCMRSPLRGVEGDSRIAA